MTNTQRSEYLLNAAQDLRLNTAIEANPPVQVTYELRPTITGKTKVITNQTGATLFAVGDKDFYVVGAVLSYVKDVTATNTHFRITSTVESDTVNILHLTGTILTVESKEISVCIPMPGLKIDRNTSIILNADNTTANFVARATVFGYFLSK